MADIDVKYFHSDMASAPAMTGEVGALIGVLDACLINGFGGGTMTNLDETGGTATGTLAGHGFEVDQIIEITGSNVSAYNTEHRITAVTANTFDFEISGSPGTASTPGDVEAAALNDWSKAHTGTDKAAYTSGATGSTGFLLRVDDTDAQNAEVRGYESMSDVDTGVNGFPTVAQEANYTWKKSETADTTERDWFLVGDNLWFFVFIKWDASDQHIGYFFGDYESYRASDAYNCVIGAYPGADAASASTSDFFEVDATENPEIYLSRPFDQSGSPINSGWVGHKLADEFGGGMITDYNGEYPNPVDNKLQIHEVEMIEGATGHALRGSAPGIYQPLHIITDAQSTNRIDLEGTLSGRRMAFVQIATNSGQGTVGFDIVGPWR